MSRTDPVIREAVWGGPQVDRAALEESVTADVCIVGAGFSGLWTAYHLLRAADPPSVVVVEAVRVGHGASGRNGGWCSALYPQSLDTLIDRFGLERTLTLRRHLRDRVPEIGRWCAEHSVPAGFAQGGTVTLASSPAHVSRLRAEASREQGIDGAAEWLEPSRATSILRTARNYGAMYTAHCAALNPAALVHALAGVVESLGGRIFERSPALTITAGDVRTPGGSVAAEHVVVATEAYRVHDPRTRRLSVPVYSLILATEPLRRSVWDEIGASGRPTFTDGRHMLIYGQRSADDRMVFGGRGAPYHLGSGISPRYERNARVFTDLYRTMTELFPATAGARITHRWGGPLGVSRNWAPFVMFRGTSGISELGGYAGDGVALSALAGETLADLIARRSTERCDLPFVNHQPPPWEPEPFRFMGIRLGQALARHADRIEARTGRPARRTSALLDRLIT